jgi:hypothetical protein
MTPTRLACAAPHPDRPGQTCNSLLAYAGEEFPIVGTAHRAPEGSYTGKGTFWLRCHRSSCGAWTEFRIPKHPKTAAA